MVPDLGNWVGVFVLHDLPPARGTDGPGARWPDPALAHSHKTTLSWCCYTAVPWSSGSTLLVMVLADSMVPVLVCCFFPGFLLFHLWVFSLGLWHPALPGPFGADVERCHRCMVGQHRGDQASM